MVGLELQNLTKRFNEVVAVDGLDLEIEPGTFLTLLGPSGCGKTTALRSIAGLEEPDRGTIRIGEKTVYSSDQGIFLRPGDRGIGLMFQTYALWPHMTVFKNVAFGLQVLGLTKTEIAQRVSESLRTLQMDGMEERYPAELSGGQQQRVALARMLATRPQVFLMDEPLSNLDARLRLDMRAELKRLHVEAEATTIYVTHDQMEAMTMSSQVAVMKDGELLQLGTPEEIYDYPATLFVAGFIGSTRINTLDATVITREGTTYLDFGSHRMSLPAVPGSQQLVAAIRAEDISVLRSETAGALPATVYSVMPTGSEVIVQVKHEDKILTARESRASRDLAFDQQVWVQWDVQDMKLYDAESQILTRLGAGAEREPGVRY